MKVEPAWFNDLPCVDQESIRAWHTIKCLRINDGNRSHTAKALGISIRGLRHYIHKLRKEGYPIPESYGRDRLN